MFYNIFQVCQASGIYIIFLTDDLELWESALLLVCQMQYLHDSE